MPAKHAGRTVGCPRCHARLVVPEAADVLEALPERFLCTVIETQIQLPIPDDDSWSDNEHEDSLLILETVTGPHKRNLDLDRLLEDPEIQYAGGSQTQTEDDSPPGAPTDGYRIKGSHRLVIHDTDRPYFRQLGAMVLALQPPKDGPIELDLRPLGQLGLTQIRRAMLALLLAEDLGKPVQLLLTPQQRKWLKSVELEQLITLRR